MGKIFILLYVTNIQPDNIVILYNILQTSNQTVRLYCILPTGNWANYTVLQNHQTDQ